jgi:hypothetical protein
MDSKRGPEGAAFSLSVGMAANWLSISFLCTKWPHRMVSMIVVNGIIQSDQHNHKDQYLNRYLEIID